MNVLGSYVSQPKIKRQNCATTNDLGHEDEITKLERWRNRIKYFATDISHRSWVCNRSRLRVNPINLMKCLHVKRVVNSLVLFSPRRDLHSPPRYLGRPGTTSNPVVAVQISLGQIIFWEPSTEPQCLATLDGEIARQVIWPRMDENNQCYTNGNVRYFKQRVFLNPILTYFPHYAVNDPYPTPHGYPPDKEILATL